MGRGGRSGKVRRGGKEIGTRKVSLVDKSVWEEAIGKDAYKEVVGPCNRCEGGICAEKRESVSVVKRRKGGGERICKRVVEEELHIAVKVTTNGAGVLCRKEGWEEEDGTELSLS